MNSLVRIISVVVAGLLIAVGVIASTIEERVAPVGSVCKKGDECAAAVVVAASGPRAGDAVYNSKCSACHASGALGAPIVGDAAAWAPRIEQGLETLTSHAWNGINKMPAKGQCGDCSEEEIAAAVQYMVDNSQ